MNHDNYLLECLVTGKEEGIAEVYRKIFPKVAKFITLNKGQQADAEDIFHRALMQLIARIKVKKFEITATLEAYLFTACKNLWRRELNKLKNRVTKDSVVELVNEERDMSYAVLEQERWELYHETFQQMSENCKEILSLFFKKVSYKAMMEKFSYASETVVRQRVFKCKEKLTLLIKSDPRYRNLKTL
ncbi:MAG: sigma-70 family RNA polymerase sigma factor [Sinomicrobium sp.]|nr:sigma-70 family RNA polymerase sigma factor [Sinomicrobium sp.]